jgi:hypothetical protein
MRERRKGARRIVDMDRYNAAMKPPTWVVYVNGHADAEYPTEGAADAHIELACKDGYTDVRKEQR